MVHLSGWPAHRVLLGHKGRVTCLLYPHDEYPRYDKEFLVSGGADFSVKLWDIFTGDLLYTFSTHAGEVLRLICTPPDCSVSLLCGAFSGLIVVTEPAKWSPIRFIIMSNTKLDDKQRESNLFNHEYDIQTGGIG